MNHSESDDRIAVVLSSAHAVINTGHDKSRARLLQSLSDTKVEAARVTRHALAWRYVVGAFGVGAAAAAIVVAVWHFTSNSPAVAMEQLAKALDQVSSYSYRMESVYVSQMGEGRTVRQVTIGRWRTDPVGLHATIQIYETLGTNTANPKPTTTLVHIEEAHEHGQRGILIDHLKQQYWWIDDEITAESIPPGSPQVAVYMVRQRRGRVLRDLGEESIAGQTARGLEIMLDAGQPVSELGVTTNADDQQGLDWRNTKVEIWIDPNTDLPIEFRCTRRGDDFETTYRFTDLKWNEVFEADAFSVDPPIEYTELNEPPYGQIHDSTE